MTAALIAVLIGAGLALAAEVIRASRREARRRRVLRRIEGVLGDGAAPLKARSLARK